MKRSTKQMLAGLLSAAVLISAMPLSAFAAQGNTDKEEVVYVNLHSDGSVKEVNVVNIFDLDQDGQIIDYGQYEEFRNMTTTDKIDSKGDRITIDGKKGRLYYEGKLEKKVIPWKINIRYYLDGKEYPAKEIAGKSGELKIKMSIKRNKACDSSFFEGYALQVVYVLDTDRASNITADGATIANAGSDKQLTYTILPNKEKEMTISADVEDFEMDAVSINAVRMNLDIDVDDEKIQEKIDEVIKAVKNLDDGAGKVKDASSKIAGATDKMDSAAAKLNNGVATLYDGADELKSGLDTLTSKNKELTEGAWTAYEGFCRVVQTQLNEQLSAYDLEKVTITPENYSEVLRNVIAQLDAERIYNKAYNTALSEVTTKVNAQADTLYQEYIRSQASVIYREYVKSQSEDLYAQVAAQAVISQLVENGYTEEEAAAYVQTEEGKILVANALSAMTDQQKEQVISLAVQNLTNEQKDQILQGTYASLTNTEKLQIREAYIQQLMASKEVTDQITAAVTKANEAAGQISELIGQLDQYGVFYNGLVDYTNAVSSAADGAGSLENGLSQLQDNMISFADSVGKLNLAAGKLNNGTKDLKEGTGEFVSQTKGMNEKLDDEIDSELSSLTGENVKIRSFVSDKNQNIKSVQFVIKGENIAAEEDAAVQTDKTEKLTFWQKLLRLFGVA